MAFREVKIYDGEFPTHEQMLSGDPTRPPFPKEVWLPQVRPGEFAVRYKDFKTGLARNPQGEHAQSSEICRIFDTLAEAKTNSRQVAAEHWTVMCVVFDHTGTQVERIFNNKRVNKFALSMYAGILFSAGWYTLAGMGVLWLIYRLGHAALFSRGEPIHSLGWLGWLGFSIAGLAVGVFAYIARPIPRWPPDGRQSSFQYQPRRSSSVRGFEPSIRNSRPERARKVSCSEKGAGRKSTAGSEKVILDGRQSDGLHLASFQKE